MATISNLTLFNNQSTTIFSPLVESPLGKELSHLDKADSQAIPENILSEIQAIQDALLSDENFDFASLEATQSGPSSQTLPPNNDKTSPTPILLEEDAIDFHYRSEIDSSISENKAEEQITRNDDSFSNEGSENHFSQNASSQYSASASEDFITQAEGTISVTTNHQAQSIEADFGTLSIDSSGHWVYNLDNQHDDVQSLAAGSSLNDNIEIDIGFGNTAQLTIQINGSNDQAVISGVKSRNIQAAEVTELDNAVLPSVSGKLAISDIDSGEARFNTNFDITGSFGTAEINAQGDWTYTLNNYADAVQGLKSGEKLVDLFTIKTLDGTKQLIQINIDGTDDKPILAGKNFSALDLETELFTQGSLTINDPDFGESSFQAHSGIKSSLGFGIAEIDTQGNWLYSLNTEFASDNMIGQGQTRIDSFDVFTFDGTKQTIHIPIQGTDTPMFSAVNESTGTLAFHDLIEDSDSESVFSKLDSPAASQELTATPSQAEALTFMNSDQGTAIGLTSNLNDVTIS